MQVHVFNIEWDTECDDDATTPNLPSEMTVDIDGWVNKDTFDDDFPDLLSDRTGFCVLGYEYEIL